MAPDRTVELNRLPALHLALAVALAGVTSLVAILLGLALHAVSHPEQYRQEADQAPSLPGIVFMVAGVVGVAYGVVVSVGLVVSAVRIRRRAGHSYCLWMAALATFFFPFGTLLGFHAIDVLTSPTAKLAFQVVAGGDAPAAPTAPSTPA